MAYIIAHTAALNLTLNVRQIIFLIQKTGFIELLHSSSIKQISLNCYTEQMKKYINISNTIPRTKQVLKCKFPFLSPLIHRIITDIQWDNLVQKQSGNHYISHKLNLSLTGKKIWTVHPCIYLCTFSSF